jgi:hypothetical protein
MDRNPNESFGGQQDAGQSGQSGFGSSGSGSGSQGYGASGASDAGSSGGFSSGSGGASTASFGTGASSGGTGSRVGQENVGDRAKDALGNAGEKVQGGLANVREKAGNLKSSLADKLEAGAEKLRSQGQSGQYAGSTGTGSVAVGETNQVTDKLATGMQRSAEWLREADLDNLRDGIENQVKTHPGRTLLIALGLGYVLGKAFRK